MHLFSAALAFFGGVLLANAQQPPPVITRPIEVWWGSYRNNEDLVGTNANQWTNVQQNMDGYLLHGAYWNQTNNPPTTNTNFRPPVVGPALATILSNKPVMLESLLAGEYPDVGSAFGYSYAGETNSAAGFSNAIANIRRLRGYGFNLKDISTDYIMSTWDRAVRFRPTWTSEEMFTALTGDWDGYSGSIFNTNAGSSDRNTYGWFRQWVERLAQAFPDIRVTAVNSPVYFPWYDGTNVLRELGENFNSYYTWLKIERHGTNYTTFYSGDGYGWQQLVSTNVDLGSATRAGFFLASLTNRAAEGRLDNVKAFPFFAQDIGDPGTPGSVTNFTTNTIDMVASGNNGLHPGTPSRDAQFYAYREFSGDGTFTARLDSLVGSNPARTNASGELPTAGLTLRESIAVNSRQVSLHANTAKQLGFLARGTTGGGLTNVMNPVTTQGTTPRWLRLVRSNNTVTALNSSDGTTWITNGSVTLTNLAAKLLVGLVCDSQVTFETAAANFSQVEFGGVAFPGNAFGGYAATTIGNAGTNATSTSSGGVFTLDAAGAGVAGSSDNLQYHHFAFTNDGTLYARLSYFADNTSPATALNPGAQLGLMMRSDTNAASPQIAVAFTPQQGLLTLARSSSSGTVAPINQSGQGLVSIQQRGTSSFRPLLRYFSGNDYLAGLHGAFPGSYSTNFAGFTTDSPYPFQKWGGNEANPDAINHRRKIILYEQWLQSRGRGHHFIANSDDPGSFDTSTQAGRDAWDVAYKQQSMRSLQLHQLEGGRPDKVIFESWYDGPFRMVPETTNGSFANLVRDGIYFLKGMSGSQRLDLLVQAPGSTNWIGAGTRQTDPSGAQSLSTTPSSMGETLVFKVRLTNSAGVPALPVLQSFETGATNGWTTDYTLTAGSLTNNVTSAIQSNDGQLVTDQAPLGGSELIEAGQTANLEVRVTPTMALAKKKILIRAFWNPQDPSLVPHDAVSLEIAPPAELIQNGDFEGGIDGWFSNDGGSVAAETSVVRSGAGAIRGSRNATYNGPAQSLLGRLIPGQTYKLTAWVRTDSATASSVKATIAYTGTNGAPPPTGVRIVNDVNNTGWKLVEGYYRHTEPNGPATLLKLYFEGPPANVALYLDDVSLTMASPIWIGAESGARGWSTTNNAANWQSGYAPVSFSGNSIAFFPSQPVSTGSITAIQNIVNNFQLNALTLGGAAPTNGVAATVGINSNSLAFVDHDGASPRLVLDATGTNLTYNVSASLILSNDVAVSGDGDTRFQVSGNISGGGLLLKTGAATISLSGSNSFSGGTTLASGAVEVVGNAALGAGSVTFSGGALRGPSAGTATVSNTLVLTTNAVTGGAIVFSAPQQLAADRTIHVVDGSTTFASALSQDGVSRKLTKTGGGTLVLAASNSFAGGLTLGDGTLEFSNAASLGRGTFTYSGGILRSLNPSGPVLTNSVLLQNNPQMEGIFTLTSALQLNADRTFDVAAGGSVTLSGSVSDDISSRKFIKTGSGTIVLSGSNSFRGYVTISNGVLRAAHASALPGTNGIDIQGGSNIATLDLAGGMTLAKSMQIVMHSQTSSPFGQLRNVSGTNILSEVLKLNGGGSRWDFHSLDGLLVFNGAISNLNAGPDAWRTLYLTGPGSGIFNGPIYDGGSNNASKLCLTFLSGNWMLAGTNKPYTGTTTVGSGASLWVDCAIASPVIVQSGGAFSGSGSTSTNLTINNGSTVLRSVTNWASVGPAFAAGRVVGASGLTNWTILLDASGLTGFTETNRTVPIFSGSLTNVSAGSVALAFYGFPGTGTWSVSTNTNTLSLLYAPASSDLFQTWSNAIAWNGKPSGPLDDADADGLSNLAEYAFGANPLQPSAGEHPAVSIVGDRLAITFKRIADPALTYEVLATNDLGASGSVIWSSTGAQNVAGPVTVTDTVTMQGLSKRFVRVRITR